jgi:hypothetical protein
VVQGRYEHTSLGELGFGTVRINDIPGSHEPGDMHFFAVLLELQLESGLIEVLLKL